MVNKLELVFHPSHLGASGGDSALELIIRALSLKHSKEGEWADKYGTDYEDEVVCIHHDLQDYDCTCQYGKDETAWMEANPHLADCFITVAGDIVGEVGRQHPVPEFDFFYRMDDVDAAEFMAFWHGGAGPTELRGDFTELFVGKQFGEGAGVLLIVPESAWGYQPYPSAGYGQLARIDVTLSSYRKQHLSAGALEHGQFRFS